MARHFENLKTTVFDLMNDDVYTKAIAIGSQMMVAPASEHVLCSFFMWNVIVFLPKDKPGIPPETILQIGE
ncbi:hypothetical protein SCA6_011900 [Theobroma cacao]